MSDDWIQPPELTPLEGSTPFAGLDATVADFWAWAMSDLRMNNVRGYLAEFLVAKAVGATGRRIEWDAYDVLTPDGVRVEVKSAAYLQAWAQRNLSRISFGNLKGRTWDPETGESPTQTFNADVYVFAIVIAQTHALFDPLDLRQWEFYVVSRSAIESIGYASIGLSTLLRLTDGPTPYDRLGESIKNAAVR